VVDAGKLHVTRTRNPFGEIAGALDDVRGVSDAIQHERR
jgi:hypothetical protein